MMELEMVNFLMSTLSSSESSSSDSDEELFVLFDNDEGAKHRITNFYPHVIYQYTNREFQSHFRLSRIAVEAVLDVIGPREHSILLPGRISIPIEKALLVTVWYLSNQESIRGISDRFNISKGHAHTVIHRVCLILYQSTYSFIRFPITRREINLEKEKFDGLRDSYFPGIVGCVDGCYIQIPGPVGDNSYYNRKGFHAVTLQGTCGADFKFLDVYCGHPGSAHDSYVWDCSLLGASLSSGRISLAPDEHLLGDSAYTVKPYLMVPFKDNGHLTAQQRRFNYILSSHRVVIEQAYGRLKGCFRRLKYLQVYNLSYVKNVIMSCCILHNVILDHNEIMEDFRNDDEDENDDEGSDEDNEEPNIITPCNTGAEKRLRFLSLVNNLN